MGTPPFEDSKMYLLLEMVVFHCYVYQRQRVMPVMQSLFASFAGTCPYARCQCENIPSYLKSPKSAPRCFESTICLFSLVYIRKCHYINLNNRSHTPYMYHMHVHMEFRKDIDKWYFLHFTKRKMPQS